MDNQFFNLFCSIVVFQTFVFAVFLWQKRRKTANIFLSLFFISEAITILDRLISGSFRSYFISQFPILINFGTAFALLWGPVYYLYVKALFDRNFTLNRRLIFHFLPFFIGWLYYLLIFQIKIFPNLGSNHWLIFYPVQIISFGIVAQLIIYNLLSIKLLKIVKNNMVDFGFKESTLNWAKFFIFGYFAGCILNIGVWFTTTFFSVQFEGLLILSGFFYFFIFFNFIFYKALIQPEIFYGPESENRKYHYTRLNPQMEIEYFESLKKFMLEKKPFFEPGITLESLSKQTNIPIRHLSQVINKYANCNFSDFVNQYRINYVKTQLLEPSGTKKNVQQLLYEAGFNSKTAFNITFKKFTGFTPSEFKKRNQPN